MQEFDPIQRTQMATDLSHKVRSSTGLHCAHVLSSTIHDQRTEFLFPV